MSLQTSSELQECKLGNLFFRYAGEEKYLDLQNADLTLQVLGTSPNLAPWIRDFMNAFISNVSWIFMFCVTKSSFWTPPWIQMILQMLVLAVYILQGVPKLMKSHLN